MAQTSYTIGDWRVEPDGNRLAQGEITTEVEPRVMDLLMLFAARPGEVLPKADIAAAIWGEVTVNEDALTRTLWKLRQALGDDAKAPRYIETVPKRGYRLIAQVSVAEGETVADASGGARPPIELIAIAGVLVIAIAGLFAASMLRSSPEVEVASDRDLLLQRADAFYAQYTRAENEAALRLYETLLANDSEDAAALAGLSNAIAQRVLRFTGPQGAVAGRTSLTEALESGWLDTEEARAALTRSESLARQATELDPGHARAWRALGLALSAQREFEPAEAVYNRALVIDPDDWGSLINLSDVADITGERARSTAYLAQAYDAMARRFAEEAVLIRPWQSRVGLGVAARKVEAGELTEAELWYRRVLSADPLNREAVSGLSALLRDGGDVSGADALCADLLRRTGQGCEG